MAQKILYGQDLSCDTDLDPAGTIVSGPFMMAQVCIRRLYCRRGQLISDSTYGIDVRDFVGSRIKSPNDVPRILMLCQQELERDERVFTADVSGSYDFKTQKLTMNVTGTGAFGPFSLTLAVTAVTVELLSVN